MNVLHIKYVVEIAKEGSISKAAEKLYVAQPNLSRAVKELESSLGITIFSRTSKGMILTDEGRDFIVYAENILNQLDELENLYSSETQESRHYSVSLPRAAYILDAFTEFAKKVHNDYNQVLFMQSDSSTAINNVLDSSSNLGLIRCEENLSNYFAKMLDDKGLKYEALVDFQYYMVMSEENILAHKPEIYLEDVRYQTLLSYVQSSILTLPWAVAKREDWFGKIDKVIYLFESGNQFELLENSPDTYMWASPLPERILKQHRLVQRKCQDNSHIYRDMIIYRKDYKLSDIDYKLIDELKKAAEACIK